MTRPRTTIEVCQIVALSLWLGVVVMSGAAAAVIFPTMKRLAPTIPDLATYTGEHWKLAGGQIANRIFLIADITQGLCALVVLLAAYAAGRSSPASLLRRVASTLGAVLVLAYFAFVRSPMQRHIGEFWAAATAGDNTRAAISQRAFDALHPIASASLGVITLVVLATLVISVWSLAAAAHKGAA